MSVELKLLIVRPCHALEDSMPLLHFLQIEHFVLFVYANKLALSRILLVLFFAIQLFSYCSRNLYSSGCILRESDLVQLTPVAPILSTNWSWVLTWSSIHAWQVLSWCIVSFWAILSKLWRPSLSCDRCSWGLSLHFSDYFALDIRSRWKTVVNVTFITDFASKRGAVLFLDQLL